MTRIVDVDDAMMTTFTSVGDNENDNDNDNDHERLKHFLMEQNQVIFMKCNFAKVNF